jgi:hypothetical protein
MPRATSKSLSGPWLFDIWDAVRPFLSFPRTVEGAKKEEFQDLVIIYWHRLEAHLGVLTKSEREELRALATPTFDMINKIRQFDSNPSGQSLLRRLSAIMKRTFNESDFDLNSEDKARARLERELWQDWQWPPGDESDFPPFELLQQLLRLRRAIRTLLRSPTHEPNAPEKVARAEFIARLWKFWSKSPAGRPHASSAQTPSQFLVAIDAELPARLKIGSRASLAEAIRTKGLRRD